MAPFRVSRSKHFVLSSNMLPGWHQISSNLARCTEYLLKKNFLHWQKAHFRLNLLLPRTLQYKSTWSSDPHFTLPETNSKFAPENGWLEDDCFLLGRPISVAKMLVSGRVDIDNKSSPNFGRLGSLVAIVALLFEDPFWTWDQHSSKSPIQGYHVKPVKHVKLWGRVQCLIFNNTQR